MKYGDLDLSYVGAREYNRPNSFFSYNIVYDDKVCNTITATNHNISYETRQYISDSDMIYASSFPTDYNFDGRRVDYVCGMSVPPLMIKRIVERMRKAKMI